MLESILDIESGIEKIEVLVRTLREDRDKARAEAAELRKALDEREIELLQLDEERERERRGYEDKMAETSRAMEDLESRIHYVADKVRNIMPLVNEYEIGAATAPSFEDRQ
ncbi:MAG: hypothetical protein LBT23_11095 [Synergistaceae bacterium]|jgi:chromosome segregation ATPase|nr:hypothetical protein [Synergistaceae bacterium]